MTFPLAAAALVGLLSQAAATPAPAPLVAPVTQAPAVAPANPFDSFFTNLGHDFKALGTADTAWIAGFGGAGALVLHHNSDQRLHTWVLQQNASATTSSNSASAGNFIGNGVVQGGGAIAVWLAGMAGHSVKVETVGADLIRAQALNGLLTQGIKFAARRTRPDGASHSFPSGHTSAAFATAAVIQRDYGTVASLPFYAMGGFVGWSRIRSNHHWLSDTVAGAAIGIISGRAATRHHKTRWTVTPVKTPGGMAVYVTRRN